TTINKALQRFPQVAIGSLRQQSLLDRSLVAAEPTGQEPLLLADPLEGLMVANHRFVEIEANLHRQPLVRSPAKRSKASSNTSRAGLLVMPRTRPTLSLDRLALPRR